MVNRFLPIALVRARGKIAGYLNHKIGIIETEDGRRPNCKVLFHSSDVYLFKTPVALSNRRYLHSTYPFYLEFFLRSSLAQNSFTRFRVGLKIDLRQCIKSDFDLFEVLKVLILVRRVNLSPLYKGN